MGGIDLSVVIASYNRRERLARVLAALAAQTVERGRFEVVVVDDGSTDGTADLVESQQLPFPARVLRQRNAGPAAARNRGVESARGRLVLFLDDDVVPEPALVSEHLESHAREGDVAVIGPLSSLPSYRQPWVAWEQANLEKQYAAMLRGDWQPTYRQFWTGNASVAREHVLAAGGFDPAFSRAEDVELAQRLAQRGLRFVFNPRARGLHHAERSLRSWEDVQRAYGRLELRIHRRWGEDEGRVILADNWSRLHPATRAVVSACLGRPALTRAAAALLRGFIQAGAALELRRPVQTACSALANLLYWDGAQRMFHPRERPR